MAAAWPNSVPEPVNSYQLQERDTVARTGDQFGVNVTRKRYTNPITVIGLSFVLTSAEDNAMQSFFDDTLYGGGRKFTASWLTLLNKPHHTAKMQQPQKTMIGGGLWSVNTEIEVSDAGELIEGYLHPFYKEIPNIAPVANDVNAGNAEVGYGSLTVTLSASDADSNLGFFYIKSLPTLGVLYEDAGLTTIAVVDKSYLASSTAKAFYYQAESVVGTDSFAYLVEDEHLKESNTATVTISVIEHVNVIPTADAKSVTVQAEISVNIIPTADAVNTTVEAAANTIPTADAVSTTVEASANTIPTADAVSTTVEASANTIPTADAVSTTVEAGA